MLANGAGVAYYENDMDSLCKPEVILTHESDLDGLLSGLLLHRLSRQLFGHATPVQAYQNDFWQKRPLNEKCAWVSDFAFEERLDKPSWTIIDHHPTAAPVKNAQLIHDPKKSASQLCYELFQQAGLGSPALDRLVHLSNVADLFLADDPDFDLANDYANLVKTYQFWNLWALIEGDPERLLDHPLLEVMAVKRRVEDPLGLNWSRHNTVPLNAKVGYVDTVVGNSNLIVHELFKQGGLPYAVLLTMFRKGNGSIVVSLRSENGEALKVAEQLHGGGHPNACGAILPRSIQRLPDAVDYLRKVLNPVPPRDPPLNSLESLFDAIQIK